MTENTESERTPIPAPLDPGSRTNRTGLAVAAAALVVLVGALPEILNIALEHVGDYLPENVRLWLLGAVGATTGLAMAFTRIMAIPAVNEFLSRWSPFGTVSRGVARGKYGAK